jgi:carbamate kinase
MTPPRDLRLVVVAIGGTALPALESTLAPLVELVSIGYRLVLTHGAGRPAGDPRAPALALDVAAAQAQGAVGYAIQQAFERLCRARRLTVASAALVTRVVVDAADPAFARPAHPTGPFYTAAQARELRRSGWTLVEAGRRGWRRVVPSPRPLRVLEADLVHRLLQAGAVAIACGAGGVPVVEEPGGYRGVDAVIETDLASEVLATGLGAFRILFLTDVERVAVNFGTPQGLEIERLTIAEARALLGAGEFAPGSMGPKVEASVRFVEAGGREAIITAPARVRAAVEGEAGTRVLAD